MSIPLHIIILAAGDGTRMKSRLPKVLHQVGGRAMLAHVHATAVGLDPQKVHIVFNPSSPEVKKTLDGHDINWVPQEQRLGTGHAVQQAMSSIPNNANTLVLYGDLPLLTIELLSRLIDCPDADLRVLTMRMTDPTGYGRIERDEQGEVVAIIEERDATTAQKAIEEANTGIILAPAKLLNQWLSGLHNDNSQGEYYLTDIFAVAASEGASISSVEADDPRDLLGANDRVQLAVLESQYRQRRAEQLMLSGVQIADPLRVELRGNISAGVDVKIDINVVLEGEIVLGNNVEIGPGCVLRDCSLADETRVHPYSVMEGVTTHGPCDIGPFARVRPGTDLRARQQDRKFRRNQEQFTGAGHKGQPPELSGRQYHRQQR